MASPETDPVKDSVRFYGSLGGQALDDRLKALEGEPELETVAILGLAGAGILAFAFGILGSRLWRIAAWLALPLIFAQALGRFRSARELLGGLGMRSRREIEEEKYALKALRGDFRDFGAGITEAQGDPARALEAVRS